MYHTILVQKNILEYKRIKKVVKLLKRMFDIEMIYYSNDLEQPACSGVITLILSESNPCTFEDIGECAWKIIKSYTEFIFCFYHKNYVETEFDEEDIEEGGSLFFILNCNERKLIYTGGEEKELFDVNNIKVKSIIEKAEKKFQMDILKIHNSGLDLQHHINSNDYFMSANILQRQFRDLFTCVSFLLTGDFIVSHSLEEKQVHLIRLNHLLGSLFDRDKKEEWDVLRQLDSAREAFLSNIKIDTISLETVEVAATKLALFEKGYTQLFQDSIGKAKKVFEDYENSRRE